MNRIFSILFLATFALSTSLWTQEFAYGFKAGLNFNSFDGDSETTSDGTKLEEFTGNTGFHVAATFTYKITDLAGVRGEFMFSQKGGRYKYDGPSYYVFPDVGGTQIVSIGNRKMTLNITNSYLDIPVMGYFKPLSWLEVYGGLNAAIMVGSSSFGELTFDQSNTGSEFMYELDYNYYTDDPGEGSGDEETTVSGVKTTIPTSAGAYFEFSEDRGNLHNLIDFGALAGLSFYLNKGLYVGLRANMSLADFTKTKADVSKMGLDANQNFITRSDKDRYLSLQVSVGFSF